MLSNITFLWLLLFLICRINITDRLQFFYIYICCFITNLSTFSFYSSEQFWLDLKPCISHNLLVFSLCISAADRVRRTSVRYLGFLQLSVTQISAFLSTTNVVTCFTNVVTCFTADSVIHNDGISFAKSLKHFQYKQSVPTTPTFNLRTCNHMLAISI